MYYKEGPIMDQETKARVIQRLQKLFTKYLQLTLQEFNQMVSHAYGEVQMNKIGTYHPIDVQPLAVDADNYEANIEHRETNSIQDESLTVPASTDDNPAGNAPLTDDLRDSQY